MGRERPFREHSKGREPRGIVPAPDNPAVNRSTPWRGDAFLVGLAL